MKAKQLVGAAIGTVGAAAVGNRVVSRRAEPLGPPLERETGSYRWRGMEIAYTEGGDPEAPDLLLVHDLHPAGTSREFNRIFDRLAESYHVFAPDLPGFGRSDRPPLTYSATLYETFLQDFVRDLTERPLCVGSGLGAAYLVAAAEETDVDRLFLVCPRTEAFPGGPGRGGSLLRAPVVGTAAFNVLASGPGIARIARNQLLYDPAVLSEHDREYYWQAAHQPGARFAPASMVAGHLDSRLDLGAVIAGLDAETTLIWGRETTTPSLQEAREIADAADVKLIVLDQSRALAHFEQAGPFLDLLAEELEATP